MARELVQRIARKADPTLPYLGYWCSEKFNGWRVWWDGGVTIGKPATEVPWANTEKDGRLKIKPISTGLWSRYGKVVHAPQWFIDQLPRGVCLDGELFHPNRQFLFSVSKQQVPGPEWHELTYHIFDLPNFGIPGLGCAQIPFYIAYPRLLQYQNTNIKRVEQTPITKLGQARDAWAAVADRGGEGIVLREPMAFYYAGRSRTLIRWKCIFHGEGVITGWKPGKGNGKYEGMVGSWTILYGSGDHELAVGKSFNMSGMDDKDRVTPPVLGTKVKFKYASVSNNDIPQEPRLDEVEE